MFRRPFLAIVFATLTIPAAAQTPAEKAIADATRQLEAALQKEKNPAEQAKLRAAIAALAPAAGQPGGPADAGRRAAVMALKEHVAALLSDPARPAKIREKEAHLKAASRGIINSSVRSTVVPKNPATGSYTFQDRSEMNATIASLKAELERLNEPAIEILKDPAKHLPPLAVKPGSVGTMPENARVTVDQVIDRQSAALTLTLSVVFVGPAGTRPPPGQKFEYPLLLTGADTSKMADGVRIALPGVYYIPGNKMVGGRTLMELVPVKLTNEDLAEVRAVKPKE